MHAGACAHATQTFSKEIGAHALWHTKHGVTIRRERHHIRLRHVALVVSVWLGQLLCAHPLRSLPGQPLLAKAGQFVVLRAKDWHLVCVRTQ